MPTFEPLIGEVEADVCVIGAGVAGLTSAVLLAHAGKDVVVLESGVVGGGDTGQTTAHLSSELDDRYSRLIQIHGVSDARLAHASHSAAIDHIEALVEEEEIDCGFERLDGYLMPASPADLRILDDELRAVHQLGWTVVEKLPRAPLAGFDSGPCLRFPGQAQLHPLKYLAGLCRALGRAGGRIHTYSHVATVRGGQTVVVRTRDCGVVHAAAAVVATNSPICDRFAVHTKQSPSMTYAVAFRVDHGRSPRALFWDTADPYHYVRSAGDLLIVGGEDHRVGQAQDGEARFAALEAWTRARFAGVTTLEHRWSGMVHESLDGLAYIGRDPAGQDNVYIATGDSGMGMTHGTIAGLLLRDLLLGVANPWTALYDPRRRPLRAAGEFIRGSLNVAAQYARWLAPGEVHGTAEIEPGSGALLRRGLRLLAVHRDAAGKLHACSAVCTHLRGPVAWNPTESTWDCTCHGSRFDALGKAIAGPASVDLAPVDLDELGEEL